MKKSQIDKKIKEVDLKIDKLVLYREKLCKEDVPGKANCLSNRWQDCVFQTSSKDCLNTDKRDCKVKEGVNRKNESGDDILLLDESGKSIKAVCVARYPPGFNFWNPDEGILGITPQINPTQVCSAGSISSVAGYHKSVVSDWLALDGKCFGKRSEERRVGKECRSRW